MFSDSFGGTVMPITNTALTNLMLLLTNKPHAAAH